MGFPLVPPVACCQGILEAISDGLGLDGQLQVEVLEGKGAGEGTRVAT